MERNTNREFCKRANGDVMIAGLGIGLVLYNLRMSVASGKVKSITVIEKYQDVIDLVAPKFEGMPIRYVCADALEYMPKEGESYDTIYFDIWPTISYENLTDMRKLRRRWARRLRRDNPECFIGCWREKDCRWLDKH
jgi:spermidine synthase